MKKCSTCKSEKPLESFARNKAMRDGLQNVCKSCQKSYRKYKPREALTCKHCKVEWYSITNRGRDYCSQKCSDAEKYIRDRENMKHNFLMTHYGISLIRYEEMWAEQEGRCYLCKIHESEAGGRGRLHVDHCHETGKVRKLLCHSCNTSIGFLERNKDNLEALLEYI